MAGKAAKAARNHEARARLAAALTVVGQRLGITVPPEPKRMKDAGLQPIVEIERFADFAEDVAAALPESKDSGDANTDAGAAKADRAAAPDTIAPQAAKPSKRGR